MHGSVRQDRITEQGAFSRMRKKPRAAEAQR